MKVKIKKMYDDVKLPVFATEGSACFDIHAYNLDVPAIISNGDSIIIDTGLQFEIPEHHVMLIYSRSGHGFKNDVRLSNCVGVIDSDYRGELKVKLIADFCVDGTPLKIYEGDRIAQAMVLKLPKMELTEVESLSSTVRGAKGFGSTNK
jgi:dUTP pyrophosphatase